MSIALSFERFIFYRTIKIALATVLKYKTFKLLYLLRPLLVILPSSIPSIIEFSVVFMILILQMFLLQKRSKTLIAQLQNNYNDECKR